MVSYSFRCALWLYKIVCCIYTLKYIGVMLWQMAPHKTLQFSNFERISVKIHLSNRIKVIFLFGIWTLSVENQRYRIENKVIFHKSSHLLRIHIHIKSIDIFLLLLFHPVLAKIYWILKKMVRVLVGVKRVIDYAVKVFISFYYCQSFFFIGFKIHIYINVIQLLSNIPMLYRICCQCGYFSYHSNWVLSFITF